MYDAYYRYLMSANPFLLFILYYTYIGVMIKKTNMSNTNTEYYI